MEEPARPDISQLITEDDEPVDNWFQERQQRLLPESLYASWRPKRPFLAAADVGLFYKISEQAVVPDVMVSLDVTVPQDWWEDHNRSYMVWEFGKPPDLVVEVVSNRKGGEEEKLARYARMGVGVSVIYDPLLLLSKRPLRVYALHVGRYVDVLDPSWLEELELGLTLWEGNYEGMKATWLRWCDHQNRILPTGLERADQERERADQERERAERLAARLRELGFDAD
ncbi:MAG: Uma2 family endonuclease [Armatimonadetes bacterium]|nr:Uma2 family endonuclease [Armatimonadota bacterium]